MAFGFAHEICGEMGLGWCRRNVGVHAGVSEGGGFPKGVAHYLGQKYGYRAEEIELYSTRVVHILEALSTRLHGQRDAGQRFYLGSTLSAVDIYSATFMALFKPLPPEQCPMPDAMRPAFETLDSATEKALDPILIGHRDFVYEEYLELPLSL